MVLIIVLFVILMGAAIYSSVSPVLIIVLFILLMGATESIYRFMLLYLEYIKDIKISFIRRDIPTLAIEVLLIIFSTFELILIFWFLWMVISNINLM